MSRSTVPDNSPACPDEGGDLPGLLGTVDALRISAARVPQEEDGPPACWTPEWVLARMVEAYTLLARTPLKTRPGLAKGFWPDTFPDAAELWDPELFVLRRKRFFDATLDDAADAPTHGQASRMDEALAWPMLYLKGRPLEADALTLYASFTAIDRPLKPWLHKRRLKAEARAARAGLSSWRDLTDLNEVVTQRALDANRRNACDRIALMLARKGTPVR